MARKVWSGPRLVVALVCFLSGPSGAQVPIDVTEETAVEENSTPSQGSSSPVVGEGAARKYFSARPKAQSSLSRLPAQTGSRYLSVQAGTFFNQEVFRWGRIHTKNNVGRFDGAVTYKVGEWINSMDLFARFGLSTFELDEGGAVRLSLMPMVAFPDAASGFPLYFGAGAGLGIFFKQLRDESALSLDYTIMAGARFFDVFENGGFLVEGGLKNHVFLLSDGQFNALYLNLGGVFQF